MIGDPVSRIDAPLKVTGAAKYAADNNLPDLAYGYLVTSTVAKGSLSKMDTAVAEKSPGVLAVYTPFNPLKLYAYGGDENDEFTPPLQDKDIRYHGQVIGLVVAETFEQARDAAATISSSYTTATPVTGIPDSPPDTGTTISATYRTSIVHHHAMEPHATVASWNGDHLTLYTATQGTPLVVSRISHALGISADSIHVINPFVGGAFGGKWGNWAHTPLTAAAAKSVGRPVKTVLTREQVSTVVGHRPATSQTVSLTAKPDGTITALTHTATVAKSNSSNFTENPATVSGTTYAGGTIKTGKNPMPVDLPATTIMRAPSEANGSFALESALDELAAKLNLDPLVLRQKNYAKTANGGKPWSSKHLDECYSTGAKAFGWSKRAPKPGQTTDGDWLVGLGMATAGYSAGRSAATLKVRLNADGTALVGGTGSDAGTGQATVFAVLGAASLGIPASRVTAALGDSALPTAANAGGSSSTASNGTAVDVAAKAAIAALIQVATSNTASPFYGKTGVAYQNGKLVAGKTSLAFGDLLTKIDMAGVEATGHSDKNTNTDYKFMSFGAHFCEVRVNKWTAEPRVSRVLSVIDAGTIVDPVTARSQIIGGVVMGLGQALLEQSIVEPNGRIANANLASYLVPVNADVPHLDVTFLNYPDTKLNPVGMRGIGELGIVGVAGAVANAVWHATGKRIRELPITLDKLLS